MYIYIIILCTVLQFKFSYPFIQAILSTLGELLSAHRLADRISVVSYELAYSILYCHAAPTPHIAEVQMQTSSSATNDSNISPLLLLTLHRSALSVLKAIFQYQPSSHRLTMLQDLMPMLAKFYLTSNSAVIVKATFAIHIGSSPSMSTYQPGLGLGLGLGAAVTNRMNAVAGTGCTGRLCHICLCSFVVHVAMWDILHSEYESFCTGSTNVIQQQSELSSMDLMKKSFIDCQWLCSSFVGELMKVSFF